MGYCLIFNPSVGASGDMILSSLVAVGSDEKYIVRNLKKVSKLKIAFKDDSKNTMTCKRLEVTGKQCSYSVEKMRMALNDFSRILKFSGGAKKFVSQTFNSLVDAESKVHGKCITHFHELGKEDTIIDLIGIAMALESLGAFKNKVYSLPMAVGEDVAPATLEILSSNKMNFFVRGVGHELCTPTGAAVLSNLTTQIECFPKMKVKKVGYGCGKADFEIPDVLGVVMAKVVGE
jgi:hypothetical protein